MIKEALHMIASAIAALAFPALIIVLFLAATP
jgi:general stress protein CsbA